LRKSRERGKPAKRRERACALFLAFRALPGGSSSLLKRGVAKELTFRDVRMPEMNGIGQANSVHLSRPTFAQTKAGLLMLNKSTLRLRESVLSVGNKNSDAARRIL
jgi:hypothetical protein